MSSPLRVPREVVSFVRRSSRMRLNQRRAWEDHRDRYVLPVPRGERSTSVAAPSPLDLTAVFGRDAPLIVEIGCGPGDSLELMAAQRPDANLLAFEVYRPAVASLVARLTAADLSNVRVVEADAVAGLQQLVPAAAIDELWTFFPDPWPKARHHKRRLVDAAFVDLVAHRLAIGGRWWLATDWTDYAAEIQALLSAHRAFAPDDRPQAPRPRTRFETRGLAAGRTITDLAYRRLP